MVSGEEIFGLDPKEIEVERSQIINDMMSYKMPSVTRVAFHLMTMERIFMLPTEARTSGYREDGRFHYSLFSL